MFTLIKHVFTALLSSSISLATKFLSLNNEPCMVRPTLIDLNPIELKYYSFLVCLDKCNRSYVFHYLSTKICVQSEIKDKC